MDTTKLVIFEEENGEIYDYPFINLLTREKFYKLLPLSIDFSKLEYIFYYYNDENDYNLPTLEFYKEHKNDMKDTPSISDIRETYTVGIGALDDPLTTEDIKKYKDIVFKVFNNKYYIDGYYGSEDEIYKIIYSKGVQYKDRDIEKEKIRDTVFKQIKTYPSKYVNKYIRYFQQGYFWSRDLFVDNKEFIPDSPLYSAIILYKNKIIAEYSGRIETNDHDEHYSSSYLSISSLYRGLGLCIPISKFTYKSVLEKTKAKYLEIKPVTPKLGYDCYVKSAIELGYNIYYFKMDGEISTKVKFTNLEDYINDVNTNESYIIISKEPL